MDYSGTDVDVQVTSMLPLCPKNGWKGGDFEAHTRSAEPQQNFGFAHAANQLVVFNNLEVKHRATEWREVQGTPTRTFFILWLYW